jgi:adenylate cyclase
LHRKAERVNYRLVNRVFLSLLAISAFVSALLALRVSGILAALAFVAVPAMILSVAHNRNPLTPWVRERDDQMFFRICEANAFATPRWMYRNLPSDPRCRACLVPFGGLGRILRIKPSGKNPNFCTDCLESAPMGLHEMEVGLLFADLRGFTAWSEKHSPAAVAAELTRFYAVASRVLTRDDALVELVGDQVMSLYLPNFPSLRERMPEVMLAAARRLILDLRDPKHEIALPIGVGLHLGIASVGNIGKGAGKDFTAVGDVVNTAARLQSCAGAGQIVLSKEFHARLVDALPDGESATFSVKGKAERLQAYVLRVTPGAPIRAA